MKPIVEEMIELIEKLAESFELVLDTETVETLKASWFVTDGSRRNRQFNKPLRRLVRWLKCDRPEMAKDIEEQGFVLDQLAIEVRKQSEVDKSEPKKRHASFSPHHIANNGREFVQTLRDLARSLKVKLGAKSKDIWDDVQPNMKDAIQEYWKEVQAKMSEGKRLYVSRFCQKKELDESEFRRVKGMVEKRKERLPKVD